MVLAVLVGLVGLAPSTARAGAASAAPAAPLNPAGAALQPCRLAGVAQAALCGRLSRPLDPARPQGVAIDLHYAVLPALARHKAADPVFFFAGGPGQSAIALAGVFSARFARLGQRRDLVLVDQRGTGRSAPLRCEDDSPQARRRLLAEDASPGARLARLQACRLALQALPYGDLRWFGTELAAADADAVRQALGVAQINAIGVSYGTRVVLALMRQHPAAVRRAVLDGVVPPDMRLADVAGRDAQAVLDGLFQACAADPACQRHHPDTAAQLQRLLASLPLTVYLPHPVSGRPERLVLDRDSLLGLVRAPLYQPALAAALPAVLAEAEAGRWAPLLALANPLGGAAASALASGMHHAVICSEDLGPDDAGLVLAPAGAGAVAAPSVPGPGVFGDLLARQYRQACAGWPRAAPAPAFYTLPPAQSPTWLLSGGLDPVTPPRHAQRVAQALGRLAQHSVVARAGHGVTGLVCMADAASRFISDDEPPSRPPWGADCAAGVPRPPAWQPPGPGTAP